MAALSYLSTYCLFRSFCSTPSCPGVGPSCALQWGRPGFKLASSPGLLGLTAPLEPSCIVPLKTAQRSQHCLSFTGACKQILLFIITDLLCHRQHCFEMEENHHSAFYLSKSVCLPGPKCVCAQTGVSAHIGAGTHSPMLETGSLAPPMNQRPTGAAGTRKGSSGFLRMCPVLPGPHGTLGPATEEIPPPKLLPMCTHKC